MNCQGNVRSGTTALGFGVCAFAVACLFARPSVASSTVEVRCDALAGERAAAFEARAHAELLVRGEDGAVRLSCPPGTLEWRPAVGVSRQLPVGALDADSLLGALESLLDAPSPAPAPEFRPEDTPPPPVEKRTAPRSTPPLADIRFGGGLRSWDAQGAFGASLGAGLSLDLLTLTASGHLSRGLVSYGGVSLHVLEARLGAELTGFDVLRFGLGAGAGRPFTLEPAGVEAIGRNQDVWFVEGIAKMSIPWRWSKALRLDLGAEVSVLSRPVRLRVDDRLGYDFAVQPGVFLEAAIEVR